MKTLPVSIWAEWLKVRRSKIFMITLITAAVIPLMIGFLMLVIKHPELASRARMLAIKATMLGKDSWDTYFADLSMIVTAGGLILFGFTASWIFGREYSDRTVKDLLALPVSRIEIVLSKFIVTAVWSFLLSLIIFIIGMAAGGLIVLSGWSWDLFLKSLGTYAGCGALTILLCTPVAFFASWGRGFLPPMAFVILTLMIINLASFTGYTPYIPWAIPMILGGSAGNGSEKLGLLNYLILSITVIAGYAGTSLWWRYRDQN